MFTGLVVARGRLSADPVASGQGGCRIVVEHPAEVGLRLGVGASLAVSGVCLTVVSGDPIHSQFELAPETLARTVLGSLHAGDWVNLEPALRMGDALGGHWVQGHVDGVVRVVERRDLGDHRVLRFETPSWAAASVVEKGSVTLDGVSLTVAAVGADWFEVALIPHTLAVTTLGERVVGDRLHLEVDVLAKYVERALAARGFGGA